MDVVDRLPAIGLAVEDEARSLLDASEILGESLGPEDQATDEDAVLGREFHEVRDMPLGNDEEMHRSLRRDIVEGQQVLVLVNLSGGHFAAHDLAEDAVAHVLL